LQQAAVVERTPSGTIIQPTTTIIPDGRGHARVIVIPRRRSYLDTGTEVSVGDRTFHDYVRLPGGDPGRPYWFFGPDLQGSGRYFVCRYFGADFLVRSANVGGLEISAKIAEHAELTNFMRAAAALKPDAFIDIGANLGLYTCILMKNRLAPRAILFEPDRRN